MKNGMQSPGGGLYPRQEKEEEMHVDGKWFISVVAGRGRYLCDSFDFFFVNRLERQGLKGRDVWGGGEGRAAGRGGLKVEENGDMKRGGA